MSKIVIITGHPGTGKTHFLSELRKHIQLPVISKDEIKEKIGDGLTSITLDLSQELGKSAFLLVQHFLTQLLQVDANFIVEGPLKSSFESSPMKELYKKYKPDIIQILTKSSAETIKNRFEHRKSTRHKVHMDNAREPMVSTESLDEFQFLEVPSVKIKIDTDSIDSELKTKVAIEKVVQFLEN